MAKQKMSKMKEAINNLYRPAIAALEANPIEGMECLLQGLKLTVKYYDDTFRVMEERHKKLAWYEFCLTPELFLAMDIHPFISETYPPLISRTQPDMVTDFIDRAQGWGVPPEVCAIDKVLVGAILADEMPEPDFIVTASAPCDSSKVGYQLMEALVDAPIYRLDAPAGNDEESLRFYAEEIKRFIPILEEETGNRFDIDRLREVVEETNRANELILEWFELRRSIPCPQSSEQLVQVYGLAFGNIGSPECTEYVRTVLDDAKARVEKNQPAVPDEKLRVVWLHVPISWHEGMYQWMEQKFGAVTVCDTLADLLRQEPIDTTDLDTMLFGLAKRGLNMTMGWFRLPVQTYRDDFLRSYEEFSGDCAIFAAHVGCKHCWAAANYIREACQQRNIPYKILNVDFIDPRVSSAETIENEVGEFLQIVLSR